MCGLKLVHQEDKYASYWLMKTEIWVKIQMCIIVQSIWNSYGVSKSCHRNGCDKPANDVGSCILSHCTGPSSVVMASRLITSA
uniref:Uncharacterized protein n=1 Tax=Kalanchoe fedtschenkoi TaxID=63787 RepID=A0A7N0RDH7_KALFE